ncbi:MAG: hypothetical protein OEZ39_15665 [Gammaproteobacteria bacterium]|nr:hypothetical protein [Gammaproteobacteria bacterium]MDH5653294.1 hypothetical protein [Gammaproteobacteria bacterium]
MSELEATQAIHLEKNTIYWTQNNDPQYTLKVTAELQGKEIVLKLTWGNQPTQEKDFNFDRPKEAYSSTESGVTISGTFTLIDWSDFVVPGVNKIINKLPVGDKTHIKTDIDNAIKSKLPTIFLFEGNVILPATAHVGMTTYMAFNLKTPGPKQATL